MATNTEQVGYELTPAPPANWAELLSKTVDDLSKIARTEVALLELTVQRVIEAQTDKIAGMLFLLVACAYGSMFVLGGVVLLIHLWLAWWLSFLITGFSVVLAGVCLQLRMSAAAKARAAEAHSAP